jgi:hypothetical protein
MKTVKVITQSIFKQTYPSLIETHFLQRSSQPWNSLADTSWINVLVTPSQEQGQACQLALQCGEEEKVSSTASLPWPRLYQLVRVIVAA